MNKILRVAGVTIALGALVGSAQQTPSAAGGRGGAGRGGAPAAPAVPNLSQRPTGASLGTIRIGASDNNIWFGWRVGIPSAAFRQLTWSEALTKADTLGVSGVEASSSQRVSAEIPKPLDYHLQTGERTAVVRRLRELNQQILAYRVDNAGSDQGAWRQVFEFAKAINVPLIIASETAPLADLDKLA